MWQRGRMCASVCLLAGPRPSGAGQRWGMWRGCDTAICPDKLDSHQSQRMIREVLGQYPPAPCISLPPLPGQHGSCLWMKALPSAEKPSKSAGISRTMADISPCWPAILLCKGPLWPMSDHSNRERGATDAKRPSNPSTSLLVGCKSANQGKEKMETTFI